MKKKKKNKKAPVILHLAEIKTEMTAEQRFELAQKIADALWVDDEHKQPPEAI